MINLEKIPVKQFQTLQSTSDFAIDAIKHHNQQCGSIVALEQTKGRGRRGSPWISNKGNLFTSIFYPSETEAESEQWICYLVALAVADVLEELLPQTSVIEIKWPNDLLINSMKIGGVLVERITHHHQNFIILGIGINIQNAPAADQLTTCLNSLGTTTTPIDLMTLITSQIDKWYAKWQAVGNEVLINNINNKLYQRNVLTKIRQGEHHISGINKGINHKGQITLKHPDGTLKSYNNGLTLN